MSEFPVEQVRSLLHIVDGSLAFAGRYRHEDSHPAHTHSFVEIAVVVGGAGVQRSLAGPLRLTVGDVLLLRPGVWHGYEQCHGLVLYNCCFSSEMLRRELAWTREDPQLGHLLWSGPYAGQRRGILTGRLDDPAFEECVGHLVRLFKTATGMPPMAHLARQRIELAAARLLHTDEPIGQVGESVGWPDPNYFARRFRSPYGLSASTYRARFTHAVRT
ncbi:hypothetical protein Q0Z83_029700 [Actinoplanes sichuanensis]|uniref:AraC family transcriptional regulator n=1 Tax=Actinoplanes sichuanensis TaxID=512349 RepID=A0ABW4AU94_9ACTN|nr:AraC family transcriptional regulator [Actinoplanes sichuanensis]BEL04779.1 hypothetical protein Q0Z83_029700 [Actinoplanes sichuanensis]